MEGTAELLRTRSPLRHPGGPASRPAGVWVGLVAVGLPAALAALAVGQPTLLLVALILPAAVAAIKRPEFAIGATLVVLGFPGTIAGHTGIPVLMVANLLLIALWVGVVLTFMFGRRERSTWLWPALLLPILYIGLSGVQLVFSEGRGDALLSFRTSTYFFAVAIALALAPWSKETYVKMAKGAALVGLAVGAYAALRFVIGASGAEQRVAEITWVSLGRPISDEIQFFGSFTFATELGSYCAALIPFSLALLLGGSAGGRHGALRNWRLISVGCVVFLLFALFASEVRTALVAAVAGCLAVIGLFGISNAFPSGRRLGIAAITILVLAVVGGGFYTLAITGGVSEGRYQRLVTEPTSDWAYAARLHRWTFAIDVASEEPFGHGLGTQGAAGQSRPQGQVGPRHVDSSYLKIAIEQGFIVLGIYIAALLSILLGLAGYVRRARGPTESALAIGAGGTLTAAAILFYAGMYIEGGTPLPLWIPVGIGLAMPATRLVTRRREGEG